MLKKSLKNSVPTLYINNNNVDISSISTINNKHVLFGDNKKNKNDKNDKNNKNEKNDDNDDIDILNDDFLESTKISKTNKKIKDLDNGIDESEEEEKTNDETENETENETNDDINDEIEESEELENPEELQEELSSDEENNNDELSSVDDSDVEINNKKKNNIKKNNNDIDSDVEEGDNNDKCYYKYNSTKVDEEIDYDEIFKDDTKQIIKTERITKPFLTKYERVRLLSDRSRQLAQGAKPLIKNCTGLSHTEIARLELKLKKIPLKIQRPIPNAGTEEWRLDELEILE